MELERGKLYQVYAAPPRFGDNRTRWLIAEYVSKVEAYVAHGMSWHKGKALRAWKEPAKHFWKGIRGGTIVTLDRGMQVRPVTDDTLAEIARLRTEIEALQKQTQGVIKELLELCE